MFQLMMFFVFMFDGTQPLDQVKMLASQSFAEREMTSAKLKITLLHNRQRDHIAEFEAVIKRSSDPEIKLRLDRVIEWYFSPTPDGILPWWQRSEFQQLMK